MNQHVYDEETKMMPAVSPGAVTVAKVLALEAANSKKFLEFMTLESHVEELKRTYRKTNYLYLNIIFVRNHNLKNI
jgi:hypothetical protein